MHSSQPLAAAAQYIAQAFVRDFELRCLARDPFGAGKLLVEEMLGAPCLRHASQLFDLTIALEEIMGLCIFQCIA